MEHRGEAKSRSLATLGMTLEKGKVIDGRLGPIDRGEAGALPRSTTRPALKVRAEEKACRSGRDDIQEGL